MTNGDRIRQMSNEEIIEGIKSIVEAFPKIDNYDLLREHVFTLDGILETFFDNYFDKVEGWVCSHDKTCYVVSGIKKALKEKRNISLEDKDPKAYWCPRTIKNTDQAINLFYKTIAFTKHDLLKEEASL